MIADSGGGFSFNGLAAGTYTVGLADATQFADPVTATVVTGQLLDSINLSLHPGGAIGGTVKDTGTGAAEAGITVVAPE